VTVGKYLGRLIRLDEAIKKAISSVKVETEVVEAELESALNAILAEDVIADEDIPPLPRSEVDGYAVRSEDLMGASPTNPVRLKMVNKYAPMGCFPISTGQYVPEGFDSVCMEEYTEREGEYVKFYKEVGKYENITPAGADIKKGEPVIKAGTVLTEFDIAALAMLNKQFIKVRRRPFIGILNTGSELIPLGEEKRPGKKVNSNEIMISLLLKQFNLSGLKLGIARDYVEEVKGRIRLGLRLCDALIITGGTAVSSEDVVLDAVREIGKVIVRGIAMRPGRPTSFAVVDGRPVFMLSGNPVACAIGLLFFAIPVLTSTFRIRSFEMKSVKARLKRRIGGYPGYRRFVRVKLSRKGEEYEADPVAIHGAGMISTLTKSDGFLVIHEDIEGYEKGRLVEVKVFRFLR